MSLFTTSAAPTGFGLTGADAGLGAVANGEAVAGSLSSAVTVGSLLGAAGAGFGAGSLAGGFVQHAANKVGPGPEVGAGIGTAAGIVAGILLAPETGGLSLLLPALLGGAIAGVKGGEIGSTTFVASENLSS